MVTAPPLCIIQARLKSSRLEHKMLLKLGNETLIERAWRIATEAFGVGHCVVAIPSGDEAGPLGGELRRINATVFAWDGPEADVLGRFYACAHTYRWHPDSVVVRLTPDDPFKSVDGLRRVAAGERLPVEVGGEAFTLAMLDAAAHPWQLAVNPCEREHITHALFRVPAPSVPAGKGWTIDTQEDYEAAVKAVERAAR